MQVGFDVFDLVKTCGVRAIEVFPHAGFRILAGGRIESKLTAVGLRSRVELLQQAGLRIEALEMWSHDSLDAALAALIAYQAGRGTAVRVGCGHDASAIYLPSRSDVGRLA
jgi:predicted nuclease with RNAse H fold